MTKQREVDGPSIEAMNFADILPEDVTAMIFDRLPFDDRARGCFVNRTWNRLNRDQILGPALELHPKQVVYPVKI